MFKKWFSVENTYSKYVEGISVRRFQMKKKLEIIALVALIIVVLLLVVGCQVSNKPDESNDESNNVHVTVYRGNMYRFTVLRFTDYDANVVCWVYKHGGISCLPLSVTELE